MKKNTSVISISDYLKWVRECHIVEAPIEKLLFFQDHLYYRGHASISWNLVPSLFRDSGRQHDEHKILQYASNMLWSELSDCILEIEKMIKLQHYGLRTRLLDVTYNPLVALYFACQMSNNSNDHKDGVVYCGYQDESPQRISQAIAEYVFNYDAMNINEKEVDKLCAKYNVNRTHFEHMHFLDPPLNNRRISSQSGAFIISPLLRDKTEAPFQYANSSYVKKDIEKAFSKKVIIPANIKTDLLKELDYLGINRATIYTDIQNKLQYINEREDNKWPIIDLS